MTTANIPNDPVAIQRFFTSRDNNANAETYVGQEQRLWYNPVTNAIYVSDGNTAGGIPVGTASGNGIPNGPTYSVQYNAGGGDFGGTSNVVISGNGISVVGNTASAYFIGDGSQLTNLPIQPGTYSNTNVASFLTTYTGNVTAGNVLTDSYLYANGASIFANVAFTGNVNLGNLYIVDQTIGGKNINGNITLLPEGSGYVVVPKLGIPVGSLIEATAAITPIVGNLVLNQVISYSSGNNLPSGSYGNPNQVAAPWAVYEFTTTPTPALQATTDTVSGLGVPASSIIQWVGTGAGNANIIVTSQTYTGLPTPVPEYGNVITVARAVTRASFQLSTTANTDIRLSPGASGNIVLGADIVPNSNADHALGSPGARFNQLWMGAGNINLQDQYLAVNQTIYAYNGNLIVGGASGLQFGNFLFYGNTMALGNAAANIIVGTANATGWVQFNRSMAVSTTTGSTAFSVGKTGLTNINVPSSIAPSQSALNIVGSSSGNIQPRANTFTGTLLQLTSQDDTSARISIDAFGATGAQNSYALISARAARGNVDTPAPLQTNDLMMRLTAVGWTGNGYAAGISRFNFAAAETFTSNVSTGTYANIQLTPIGSNAIKTVTSFNANGVGFPNAISGGTGNLGITFQDGSFQSTAYIASNVVNSVTVNLGLSQNQTTGAITIDNTGVLQATGTPQQIQVNGSYTVPQTGNIVLGLPQDIATNSTVTFGNITITGNLFVTGNTVSGNTIGINGKILYLANNSVSNTAINFGGMALGNVDEPYSRTILYDLNNNRWTTAGQANSSGTSNFYTPVAYSANVVTDYLDVTYTGHFGTAYDGNDFTSAEIQAYADRNDFSQIVNWNKNQGSGASADFVAVNNLGNTTNNLYYIDLGINSNTYANTDYAVSGFNDGYLYNNGGNLIIGTQTAGNVIKFHTGGTNNVNYIRAVITDAGLSVAGNVDSANVNSLGLVKGVTVSATGSVVGQNVYALNNINAVGSVTAQTLVANTTISASGTITGGNLRTTTGGYISTTGNVIAGNLVTATTTIDGGVSTSGTVVAGNITTAGSISAVGTVTGGNIISLATVSGVSVIASGNITGANINSINIVSAGGMVVAGNIQTSGFVSVTGNIDAGNIRTSGLVVGTTLSATGNIIGSYIFGNGSQLTGLNAFQTVAANGTNLLATSTSGVLTVTPGNNLVITSNSITDTMTVAVSNSPTFSGNVNAAYFIGNGSQLTGIVSSYGNSNVNTLLAAWGSNTVSTTGNATVGNISATNHTGTTVSVTGNTTAGNILTAGIMSSTGNATHGNVSATGNIADANGLLRSLPINPQGGAYTLTANDNGNLISITSGNVTVPASVFASPFGQAVTVYNNSGTTRYITQGAGTTLRLAGTAATGNRTLAQYGLSTIVCVSANTFVVSGVGLS
jgi:hypothetical protein